MPQIQSPRTNPNALSDLFDYLTTRAGENTRAFASRVRNDPGGEALNFMPMGMAGNLAKLTAAEKDSLIGLLRRRSVMTNNEFRPVVETTAGRQVIGEPGTGHGRLYDQLTAKEANSSPRPIHGFQTAADDVLVPYPIKDALTNDEGLVQTMRDMLNVPKSQEHGKLDSLLRIWDSLKDWPSRGS